jgi:hypothetical protein
VTPGSNANNSSFVRKAPNVHQQSFGPGMQQRDANEPMLHLQNSVGSSFGDAIVRPFNVNSTPNI